MIIVFQKSWRLRVKKMFKVTHLKNRKYIVIHIDTSFIVTLS